MEERYQLLHICQLDAILRSRWFLDCEMSCFVSSVRLGCFVPKFKENLHCHPAFITRDINICRESYLKGRLNSMVRKSRHCCKSYNTQISFKAHRKTFRHLWRYYEVQFVSPYMMYLPNSKKLTADFSASKLKMAENEKWRSGLWWVLKIICMLNSTDRSPWFSKSLLSSCCEKCWYLWWWKWDGNGYSL